MLRTWQQKCWQAYQAIDRHIFMLEACPGSGKTKMALHVVKELLAAGTIDFFVVVAPTDYIRAQWARSAYESGIKLLPMKNSRNHLNYHGIAISYAQMILFSDFLARLCWTKRVLVIFDEVHHAGDDKAWGEAMAKSFANAARILNISGTPFRSDNSMIPFVEYRGGISTNDFAYSYGEAIQDKICRNIVFAAVGGEGTWQERNAVEKRASFGDALEEGESARLLRTVLDVENDFIYDFLQQASKKLAQLRRFDQIDAGGLVIAMNQDHARALAALLAKIDGAEPMLAISDDNEAADKIRNFKASAAPWLVTVKMVSEGVDIPRLRVLAYASNVRTEMFFRQAVGRVVRVQSGRENDQAYFYFPAEASLVEFAERIEAERKHVLEQPVNKIEGNGILPDFMKRKSNDFVPLEANTQGVTILREASELDQITLLRNRIAGLTEKLCTLIGADLDDIEATWKEHPGSWGDSEIEKLQAKEAWLKGKLERLNIVTTFGYIPK